MNRQLFTRIWMLLLVSVLVIPLMAQSVTVNVTKAGGLWDALEAEGITDFTKVKNLTVRGTLGNSDFLLIKNQMTDLITVDISGTDVTEIPENTFSNRESLTTVRLPEGITNFGNNAFNNCRQLEIVTFGSQNAVKGKIVFPATLRYVNSSVFSYCEKFTHLDFSACSKLETIGSEALGGLKNLTELLLPSEGNLRLGWNCIFVNSYWDEATQQEVCKGLQQLTITKAVTWIEGYCMPRTIKTLFVESATPPSCNESAFNSMLEGDTSGMTIYVPKGSKRNYAIANGWSRLYQFMQETGFKINITGYGWLQQGNATYTNGDVCMGVSGSALTLKAVPNPGCQLISVNVNGNAMSVAADGTFTIPATTTTGTINVAFTANMTVVNNLNGGQLKDNIAALGINASTLSTIKIVGTLNNKDWNYIKSNLPALEGFDISETDVQSIPEQIFYEHQKITTVHLPSSVTTIGNDAFRNCPQLTTVEGCENIQEIGSSAFNSCQKLANFPFGDKIKSIQSYAFCNCTSLPETLVMPASLTTLGWNDVFNYSSIRTFDLSQCTLNSSIASNAFGECTSLTLPEKGEYYLSCSALSNARLTELRLPAAVRGLDCDNVLPSTLKHLYVSRTEPISVSNNAFNNVDFDNCTLYVPKGSADAYAEAPYWSDFTKVKELGFKITISGYGTVQNGNITYSNGDVYMPTQGSTATLKAVPDFGCELISVTLNDNAVSVAADGSITIPASVTTGTINVVFSANQMVIDNPNGGQLKDQIAAMGITARNIRALKVVGKMATKDWNYVKSNLTALEDFDISETDVKSIPEQIFDGNQIIKAIHLPSSVTTISNYAFRNCPQLITVEGCENIQEIGSDAFSSCQKLTNFPFGNAIKSIESGAFRDCTSLPETLVMPASLTSLGWNGVFNESSIRSFDLSQCTLSNSFAYNTFGKCTSLLLPEKGDYQLGYYAFKDALLTELRLPSAISYIGGENVLPDILERLYVSRATPFNVDKNSFNNIDFDNCTLYVPVGAIDAYSEKNTWNQFTNIKEYGLRVSISGYGTLQQGNVIYGNGDIIFATSGSAITLRAVPEPGCELLSVKFNDTELSVEADGSFTIPAGIELGTLNVAFTDNPILVENPNGGELKDKITAMGNAKTLCALKVTGKMNNKDWNFVMSNLPLLEMFDISETDVTTIPESAFSGKQQLVTVHLPTTVITISNSAFNSCPLLDVVDGCDNVQEIGSNAFSYCPKLSVFPFGNKIREIESSAFYYCSSLPETLVMPTSLKELGWSSIFEGSSIRNFDLSQCTLSGGMSDNIFGNCTSLLLPENGNYYLSCNALTNAQLKELRLPVALSSLSCSNVLPTTLQRLFVSRTEPLSVDKNTFNNLDLDICTLYVPVGALDAYSEANGWSEFTNIKESGFKVVTGGLGAVKYGEITYKEGEFFFPPVGEDITLQIIPMPGYEVDMLKVNGQAFDYTADGIFTIPATITGGNIEVTFDQKQLQMTIAIEGNGSFTINNETYTEAATTLPVKGGDMVSLALQPAEGYFVKQVTINGEDVILKNGGLEITTPDMDVNTNIAITFSSDAESIAIVTFAQEGFGQVNYGNVTFEDASTLTLLKGKSIALEFIPSGDSNLQTLKVNGTDVTADVISNVYALNNVTTNTTVSTTFFSPNMIAVENPNGGELKEMIAAMGSSPATICALKVIGKMNTKDWNFVKGNLPVLEEFDVSETDVKFIPEEVFSNRNSLTTVHLPSTLTVIQNAVFRSCYSLTVVDGCENVQEIGSDAFQYCTQLSNFPFGNKIKSIESGAFYNCTSLPEILVMPASLTSLGWNGVFNESSIRSFDLSQCTLSNSFAYNTFGKCTSLLLPEKGDYQLGYYAFKDALLTELRLPAAVSAIYGDNVMPTILEHLYVSRTEPVSTYKDAFKNLDMEGCTLYVPIGSKSNYEEAENWSNFTNIKEYGLQVVVAEQGKVRAGSQTLMGTTVYFPAGETATFEIQPIAGWHAESVISNDVPVSFTDNKFTLTGDQLFGKLAVSFAINQFNLQLQIAGEGKVKLGSLEYTENQTLPVDSLAKLNFTLEPAEGLVVNAITFNGKESVVQNGGKNYVTPAITANSTLVITFGPAGAAGDVATYTVTTGEGGTVEYLNTSLLPQTTINVKKGVDAVFTLKPDDYYIIDKVKLNNQDVTDQVDAGGQLTVTNVNVDATLEVTFVMNSEIEIALEDGVRLNNALTEAQKQKVTKLTVTGQLWEEDFRTMRDQMPELTELDLSEATCEWIPYRAFCLSDSWDNPVGKSSLISVRLPKNVRSISSFAFAGCSNLKEVNFTELTNLESMDSRAFAYTALNVIDLRQTKLESIGDQFYKVKGLENVKLPSAITYLGSMFNESDLMEIDLSNCTNLKTLDNTFSSSKKLERVILPEGLTSLNNAFNGCESLMTINFPKSLLSIGGWTFYGTKLQIVDLSSCAELASIGSYAFCNCTELTDVVLPLSLLTLDNSAFSSSAIKSIDLSKTKLKDIKGYMFSSCRQLESVKLPAELKSIENYAFNGCEKLSSMIELPATITSIGEGAFGGTQVAVVRCNATTPPSITNYSFGDKWEAAFVPEGYGDIYKNTEIWEDKTILDREVHVEVTVSFEGNLSRDIVEQTNTLPPTITHLKIHGPIGVEDFKQMRLNMTVLYDLDMEDAECSIIPENALLDKKVLMNVKLPRELLIIQENAFRGCSSLKGTMTLPAGVTTIGWGAFQGCSSLEKVEFSDALQIIRGYAFEGCTSLQQEVYFPQNFTSIGSHAFANCRNLFGTVKFNKEFYMFMGNEGYWASDGYAFENCANIEAVDLSECEYLYQLPVGVFRNCTSLRSVQLPPYLDRIENEGFAYDTNLQDIEFPQSLMYIDDYAFYNCSSLKHVNISQCNSFATIGNYAFAECASLVSANLPSTLNWIHTRAFSNCRKLNEINVEAVQPADLGDQVFYHVHFDRCVLSIPTGTYYDYLSAPQWGAFVNMRKAIDVTLDEGASLTYSSSGDEEENGPANAPRYASHRAGSTDDQQGNVSVKDGSSLYVAENDKITFYINPDENVSIKQVLFNGEDVTSQLQGNAFVTPAMTENTSFKVLLNVEGPIKVRELRMLEQDVYIRVAESHKIMATVYPSNATNKTILWSSSDEQVARVSEDGTVTGIAAGRVEITAKTEDGGFEKTCELVVMSNDYYITLADEVNSFIDNVAQLPLMLHNAEAAQGIQFDVYLPEGLDMDSNGYSIQMSGRSQNHTVAAARRSDGSTRVIVYSQDGASFNGNDGLLLTLPIITRESVGDYKVEVKNINISGPNSFNFSAPDYMATIHVADYPLGDSNGNGFVSIQDATNTVDEILERWTDRFIRKAADVNCDGVITVSDVTATIDIILERPTALNQANRAAVTSDDKIFIDDFKLVNGQQQTINLQLTNTGHYTAFQCDIVLPEGLTIAENEQQVPMISISSANAQDHIVQANYVGSGALRLLVMSMNNTAFATNANDVVTLTFEANAETLGQKVINIENVRLVDVESRTESEAPDTQATVEIVDTPSGIQQMVAINDFKIRVEGHELVVVAEADGVLRLTSMDGKQRMLQVKAGEQRFTINQAGVYAIENRKIMIK